MSKANNALSVLKKNLDIFDMIDLIALLSEYVEVQTRKRMEDALEPKTVSENEL